MNPTQNLPRLHLSQSTAQVPTRFYKDRHGLPPPTFTSLTSQPPTLTLTHSAQPHSSLALPQACPTHSHFRDFALDLSAWNALLPETHTAGSFHHVPLSPLFSCHLHREALSDLVKNGHTITPSLLLSCFLFFFLTVLNVSCCHIKDSFICLFNVGCKGSWMTLMWPQQIQNIKREKFPEPLVYLSSVSAGKANNPKKATEQAWRLFSKFGGPHRAAFWQWGSQPSSANTKLYDPGQSAPPP